MYCLITRYSIEVIKYKQRGECRVGNRKDLKIRSLSKWRYRELKYFCLQYPEWQRELKNNTSAVQAISITDMPTTHKVGNSTQRLALKRVELEKKCKLIEQCAIEADREIYMWLIKNATLGIPYECLDVPCGRRKFYESRRRFFNILSEKGNQCTLLSV